MAKFIDLKGLNKILMKITSLLFLTLASFFTAEAQQTPFQSSNKWNIPSGNERWDYLKVENNRLYVSHTDRVHVLDAATSKVLGEISQLKGVHGIAPVSFVGKGYITNGATNEITVFDLKSFQVLKTVAIPGKKADAILFDPYSKRVFIFNNGSGNAVVMDPETDEVIGQVEMGGAPEFSVSDLQGSIFNNNEDSHEIIEIDAKSLDIKHRYSLAPNEVPTGLAMDIQHQRLFSVCRKTKTMVVMDAKTGKIIATLPIGVGVDGVVFDPKLNLIIASNADGTATVIKQNSKDSYSVIQTIQTAKGLRTIAIEEKSHRIFMPGATFGEDGKSLVPGSFGVLVLQAGK
jgi:DNA-binding beta-propeller fold protein YncE